MIKLPRPIRTSPGKICVGCKTFKLECDYLTRIFRGRTYLRSMCRDCYREYNKKYVLRYSPKARSNKFFGGNLIKVLERDKYSCVSCGVTDEEHRKRFNCRITVDHIDGMGRNVPIDRKNNQLDNLQTLCLPCHGRKDVKRRNAK